MEQLSMLKEQLGRFKTQRAVEQDKLYAAIGILKTEFGIDMDNAQTEHDTLTNTIIPQLIRKRDNMLRKAEDILNGIDADTENHTGPGTHRGPVKNRQSVGLSKGF